MHCTVVDDESYRAACRSILLLRDAVTQVGPRLL